MQRRATRTVLVENASAVAKKPIKCLRIECVDGMDDDVVVETRQH